MKIRIDSASGPEIMEVDFSKMEDNQLKAFAAAGSSEAQEELKNRTGIDVYKPIEDVTGDDVKEFAEWLKNNDPEKYNTIIKSSSDEK